KAARNDWLSAWAKRNLLVNSAQIANQVLGRQRYHPRTLWGWQLRPEERMLAWVSIFTDSEKHRWLTRSAGAVADTQPAARQLRGVSRPYSRQKWFSNFAYLDVKVPLVDDLLMKVDKMSMAASLEARCPFLDYHLVEYAATLPESVKLREGSNKTILRRVAAGLLPEHIINRKKHGFDVPLKRWLSEDLRTYFWDMVSSRGFEDLAIIDRPQVEEIWAEMIRDVPTRTRQIWSILILATWINLAAA
ncbi:MAG: asparagine synthase C-terminal domain-containing protein, partial [Anaerolineaceae bacterium]